MSTKYKHGDRVPTDVLCERIQELVRTITHGRSNALLVSEFSMRVPAELDRDADLVMSEVAKRLLDAEAKIETVLGWCRGNIESNSQVTTFAVQVRDLFERA